MDHEIIEDLRLQAERYSSHSTPSMIDLSQLYSQQTVRL